MKGDRTVEAERVALVAEGCGGALRRWFAPDAAKAPSGTRPAPGEGRFVSRGPGAAPVPPAGGKGVVNGLFVPPRCSAASPTPPPPPPPRTGTP